MLRLAYPNKAKYCSQGHGHRITELPYDETNKHESAKTQKPEIGNAQITE
jgi:hypothetical protein